MQDEPADKKGHNDDVSGKVDIEYAREKYAIQLTELKEMDFNDEDKNLATLAQVDGVVYQAVIILEEDEFDKEGESDHGKCAKGS